LYQGSSAFATAANQAICIYDLLDIQANRSYNLSMGGVGPYVWDDDKKAINLARHGIDFVAALSLEWEQSIVWQDLRRDYGERRYLVLAKIAGRVHLMAFTPRGGYLRIISLRKANRKEVRRYEKEV